MDTAIDAARRIGCTAVQVFPSNPKGWHYMPLSPERAAAARVAWADAGVCPLTIHAPYIINLASPDEALYHNSRQALRNSLSRGEELGAPFVVVHLGSHKGTGEAAGATRLLEATAWALDGMAGATSVLLENNVGAGNSMAGTLEALGALRRDAAHPRIGVCIDTAHLWGSGYDLSTIEGVARAVEAIERAIGLAHVRVLHANDSPVPLGSHRDQHAHLGQGQIGYEGLAAFLTHPGLSGIPVVLETPDGGVEQEIIRVRTAALLCLGDADAARALQEALLPPGTPAATAIADAP
jgi:deoxyribonuclease-4